MVCGSLGGDSNIDKMGFCSLRFEVAMTLLLLINSRLKLKAKVIHLVFLNPTPSEQSDLSGKGVHPL